MGGVGEGQGKGTEGLNGRGRGRTGEGQGKGKEGLNGKVGGFE